MLGCASDATWFSTLQRSWWKPWKAYIGVVEENGRLQSVEEGSSTEEHPGPIPNNELLTSTDDHTTLRSDLHEGDNFKILSEGSWEYLSKLYGESGQQSLQDRSCQHILTAQHCRALPLHYSSILSCRGLSAESAAACVEEMLALLLRRPLRGVQHLMTLITCRWWAGHSPQGCHNQRCARAGGGVSADCQSLQVAGAGQSKAAPDQQAGLAPYSG